MLTRNEMERIYNLNDTTALKDALINLYHEKSATDNYIFGVEKAGKMYACYVNHMTAEEMAELLVVESGALRTRATNAHKELIFTRANKVEELCDMETFKKEKARKFVNAKGKLVSYNKGETLERLVTERAGQTWNKDNVDWWTDGDLTVNGIKWQIKHENKATYTHRKQILDRVTEWTALA